MVAELAGLPVPWWIAGGFAIDAFAGSGRRGHEDIDVGFFIDDQLAVEAHFAAWEMHYADPPGSLTPWPKGTRLPAHVHDIWARANSDDAWRFQFMLNPGSAERLVYRRNPTISWTFEEATWMSDGVFAISRLKSSCFTRRSAATGAQSMSRTFPTACRC